MSDRSLQSPLDRQIRVFISSTFRDMQEERNYLVKFTFPELRKLCESRGVVWGEVDLRWGVTDEESAEGRVLPICLEEIRRCKPYFIGLLGERYGWIPNEIPKDLLDREPWLKEHLHGKTSVTEMEILQGVLLDPKMAGHAFFYFRDPNFIERIASDKRGDFQTEDSALHDKLEGLKQRIRQSGLPVRENFFDAKALGELVRADLTKVINDRWPEGSESDPLDREAMDHEAYSQSRRRVYIGGDKYYPQLDAHADGDGKTPLVIVGESGSGKSALLANWVERYSGGHRDVLVIKHFIGASPFSANWTAMLRRIMGEFKRKMAIPQEIPDNVDSLRSAFPNWLHMAAAKGRVVLVLDALSQLEDRDGAPDLVWLPPVMPANVRLIVSTLSGRPLEEINKRAWPTLKVEPLDRQQRGELVAKYLKESFSKQLNPARVQHIAATMQAENPLYLRVLLDELRLFGEHEKLDERIEYYLKANSPYELYMKVIARWEEDYEGDSDLVGDTLTMLWASRRGLSESELLESLGHDGQPLPRAIWSPLFLAMSDSISSQGGLLTFAHDFLRQAARNAYLPTEEGQHRAHLRLAHYFERYGDSARRIDELPWQLLRSRAWLKLYQLLSSPDFLHDAVLANELDVQHYWAEVEINSPLRMADAYSPLLRQLEQHNPTHLIALAQILRHTGHAQEAAATSQFLIKWCREIGFQNGLARFLRDEAGILQHAGKLKAAMDRYKEAEQIYRNLGDTLDLAHCLGDEAIILSLEGDLDGALALHRSTAGVCVETGDQNGLAISLTNQANIRRQQGALDEALELYVKAEHIYRILADRQCIAECLGRKGNVIADQGEYDTAMALYYEEERIHRDLGNKYGLAVCLGNQAVTFRPSDLAREMSLLDEQEKICRELDDKHLLQSCLGSRARVLHQSGDLAQAIALCGERTQICLDAGYNDALPDCFNRTALLMYDFGDLDGAMTLFREAEKIIRAQGNGLALYECLGNQALILRDRGDLDAAMTMQKEAEQICREAGNKYGLANSLGNQANLLADRGDWAGAIALDEKVEELFLDMNDTSGLLNALRNKALHLGEAGKWDKAIASHRQVEVLCRQLGKAEDLVRSLAAQAMLLSRNLGRNREARPLIEEAARLVNENHLSRYAEIVSSLLHEIEG